MPMKKLLAILSVSMLLLSAGCKQDDEVLPRQKQSIVSFLTGSNSPRLIAEEDLAASIDVDPPYYTVSGNTVYRYIANIYDADRPSRPEVGRRSRVTVTYRAYLFENRAIDARTMPYDSNDPALAEALYEAGLTPGAWVFEPLVVEMDGGGIINGLRQALLGCRKGDVVEAYMTYNMAYGDENFGIVPLESPVAWFFTVDDVE